MGVQDVPEEAGRRLLGSGPTMTALPFKWFCAGRCDGHCGWGGGRGDDCGARRFVAGGRIGAVALYRGFEDRWCAALTRCDRSLRGRGYSVVPTCHGDLLDGRDKGTKTTFDCLPTPGAARPAVGDRVRLLRNPPPPKGTPADHRLGKYSFADYDRRLPLLWLGIAFVVLLLATGRFHGLRALVGLAASLLIILKFVIRGALEVSHDHIAATVNTLVFAYEGAALPVLLIFSIGGTPFTDALNSESVAEEIVAALIGSIGLIASMPITTALAALLAPRMSDKQLAEAHAHAH